MASPVSEISFFNIAPEKLLPYEKIISETGLQDKLMNKLIPSLAFPNCGVLNRTDSGMIYIKVNDLVINQLLPLIEKRGFVKPPFFGLDFKGKPMIGAHITVIPAKEMVQSAKSVGKAFSYSVVSFKTLQPDNWKGIKHIATLQLASPELEQFRKEMGLSPKPNGYDFSITIGVIDEIASFNLREKFHQKEPERSDQKEPEKTDQKEMVPSPSASALPLRSFPLSSISRSDLDDYELMLERLQELGMSDKPKPVAYDRLGEARFRRLEADRLEALEAESRLDFYGYGTIFKDRDYPAIHKLLPEKDKKLFESAIALKKDGSSLEITKRFIASTISLFDCTGKLIQDEKHSIYLKVDDAFIHCFNPYCEGFEKPPFLGTFPNGKKKWGAHITVMRAEEAIEKRVRIRFDASIPFTFKDFSIVEPKFWKTVRKAAIISVESSGLEQFREISGLDRKLKGHDFHITIGTIPD